MTTVSSDPLDEAAGREAATAAPQPDPPLAPPASASDLLEELVKRLAQDEARNFITNLVNPAIADDRRRLGEIEERLDRLDAEDAEMPEEVKADIKQWINDAVVAATPNFRQLVSEEFDRRRITAPTGQPTNQRDLTKIELALIALVALAIGAMVLFLTVNRGHVTHNELWGAGIVLAIVVGGGVAFSLRHMLSTKSNLRDTVERRRDERALKNSERIERARRARAAEAAAAAASAAASAPTAPIAPVSPPIPPAT